VIKKERGVSDDQSVVVNLHESEFGEFALFEGKIIYVLRFALVYLSIY
jgi:hypothetical protein